MARDSPDPGPGPRLLPGALVLRRDARTLQIGTGPGVVVRDRPGLGRVLRMLDGSLPLPRLTAQVRRDVPEFTDDVAETITRLVAAGAVVLPSPAAPPRVAVRHDRSSGDFAAWVSDGLGPPALDPEVEVLVSAGEPARTPFEVLVSAGIPHLPVVLGEHRVRLGPFVVPGRTPCLRCLDDLLTGDDPAWAGLLPQFERSRLLPVSLPPALLLRAAAETIAQVEAHLAGERPPTAGRVLALGPAHGDVDERRVPFSAACACSLLAA